MFHNLCREIPQGFRVVISQRRFLVHGPSKRGPTLFIKGGAFFLLGIFFFGIKMGMRGQPRILAPNRRVARLGARLPRELSLVRASLLT